MGDIYLDTDIGCQLILKNARYVPDIRLNLVPTKKLDDEGYHSSQGGGKWKLSKGSLIIARKKEQNTLYLMQAKLGKGEVNAIRDCSIDF